MQITKKQLKEYKKIKEACSCLRYEIDNMIGTDAGYDNSVIFNYNKGYPKPESIVGFDYDKLYYKKDLLKQKEEEVKFIEEFIDSIQDDRVRLVFTLYYKHDKTWKQVSDEIGYHGNEDYPRICIHDKFLKDNQIK